MANLSYTGITSLDGYTVDTDGNFDWGAPDEEVHAYVNDLERRIGTYLYGRRLYETMVYWENLPLDDAPPGARDFAELWRAANKIVYSRTLTAVASKRTVLMPEFDPAAVAELKSASHTPFSVGGATLAAEAIRAGLVDEFHQFLCPVVVGGGTPYFPANVKLDLELVDEHRFAGGVVHLHYRMRA
jgi:dihydrofolate reductase